MKKSNYIKSIKTESLYDLLVKAVAMAAIQIIPAVAFIVHLGWATYTQFSYFMEPTGVIIMTVIDVIVTTVAIFYGSYKIFNDTFFFSSVINIIKELADRNWL